MQEILFNIPACSFYHSIICSLIRKVNTKAVLHLKAEDFLTLYRLSVSFSAHKQFNYNMQQISKSHRFCFQLLVPEPSKAACQYCSVVTALCSRMMVILHWNLDWVVQLYGVLIAGYMTSSILCVYFRLLRS